MIDIIGIGTEHLICKILISINTWNHIFSEMMNKFENNTSIRQIQSLQQFLAS